MDHEVTEAELTRRAVAGDRASLSQLLLIHYDDLQRHIAGHMSSDLKGVLLVEDVLQQTFVRAARGIGNFELRGPGSLRAWLKTIAGNLVKDAQKRRRRERRARAPCAAAGSSLADGVERLACETASPSGPLKRRESIRRLQAALDSLPSDQREVLRRYYLQGQSLEQIALALDRSKDSVRGICYRARKNLRVLMGRSSLYFSS